MRPRVPAKSCDCLPTRTLGPVTQTDIVRFAGAGGDFNPLHHDPAAATAAGFPQPIAMGQLTAGLLAGWLTDWCSVENMRALGIRFTAPLTIGATVTLSGEVTDVDQQGVATVRARAAAGETPLATAQARVSVA